MKPVLTVIKVEFKSYTHLPINSFVSKKSIKISWTSPKSFVLAHKHEYIGYAYHVHSVKK